MWHLYSDLFFDIPTVKLTKTLKEMHVVFLVAGPERNPALNFDQENIESATMASLGDTAEGGANEEFSDIIKWRSGMLVHPDIYPYGFIIEMIDVAESW